MTNIVIEVIGLSFWYEGREKTQVLKNINLEIKENEFLCVVGPSGCGKTTLLNLIAGFLKPKQGKILYKGEQIKGISPKRGLVFQEDAVFPWLTVYQNVEYGLISRNIPSKSRSIIVDEHIDLVNLSNFGKAYPKELSTGMRKRVDVARVLANDPEILLMDEPFGALDAFTKENLQLRLIKIWESLKKTCIFITHDLEEALFLGDRVGILFNDPNIPLKLYEVPFGRPRKAGLKANEQFQKIRSDIMKDFLTPEKE